MERTTPADPATTDSEARRRAHDALDRAFTTRQLRGQSSTGVNLSRFTDALRELAVPIEVGRHDRPRPAAAERNRHGAEDPAASPPERDEAAAERGGATPDGSAIAAAIRKVTGQGTVNVVVNGVPFPVEWHPDDEFAALIQRAIAAAGIRPPDPGERWQLWQLRTATGELLEPGARCGLDFEADKTLFVDPAEGGGAAGAEEAADEPGEQPAADPRGIPPEGSRERTIFDTLRGATARLGNGVGGVLTVRSAAALAAIVEAELRGVDTVQGLFGLSRDDEWAQRIVMHAIVAGQECDVPFPAGAVDAVLRDFGIRPSLPRTWPSRGEEVDPDAHEEAEAPEDVPTSMPPGLRLSERELWGRAQDPTVFKVLARLARERAPAPDVQAIRALEAVKEALDRVDAPQAPSLVQRIDLLYGEVVDVSADGQTARRELVDIGNELDRISIPRAIDSDTIDLRGRVGLLVQRYLANSTVVNALTGPRDAGEEVTRKLAAGEGWRGTPPNEGSRRAVIHDALRRQDVLSETELRELGDAIESALLHATIAGEAEEEARPRELHVVLANQGEHTPFMAFVELEDGNGAGVGGFEHRTVGAYTHIVLPYPGTTEGLSDVTGRRIAKTLEALTVSAGGALRELLDRTATDREAR